MHMHVPRLPINRLIYMLMGVALAVGLLVSVVVRPDSRLAASADCYGICPSGTTLSMSHSNITYGSEQVQKFTATVSAGASGTGVPTGYVVVEAGTSILCTIRLSGGTGTCSPGAIALAAGRHTIVANYTGDKSFDSSMSSGHALTVMSPSRTALTLSRTTVKYGREQLLRFGITVRAGAGAPGSGPPKGWGSVVVTAGPKTLCSIALSRTGTASCYPSSTALRPGNYTLVAKYSGSTIFNPSVSSRKALLVVR
jgi:hypothetical protein